MLTFDGNSAPYLQMAHARIQSILRKADTPVTAVITIVEPAEHTLALDLLDFGDVIDRVAETLEFHRLAGYLFRLATAFTRFWEQCPVLRAEDGIRQSRLALWDLTGRVLRQGLKLLGITAPERM